MPLPSHLIEKASVGQIEDPVLHTCRDIAHRARNGDANDEGLSLLLLCMAPLLDELIGYRERAAADLELVSLPANVVRLHGGA